MTCSSISVEDNCFTFHPPILFFPSVSITSLLPGLQTKQRSLGLTPSYPLDWNSLQRCYMQQLD